MSAFSSWPSLIDLAKLRLKESLMCSAKTILAGFASLALLLAAMASVATAQSTYSYLWDNGGGNNNWGTGTNWGPNPPANLGVNNVTPSAFFEEQGLINNGNTVNVTTSQTQFSGSAADNAAAAAGVTVDGVTAVGNGSKLNIASGGSLSILITYGNNGAPPSTTPTATTGNSTLLNHGSITVQPGGTLTVKGNVAITSGTVTVGGAAAGGTLTAGNLNEAGTNSALNLLGSAIVNVSNGTVLNGTTTITGPSVVFNTPSLSMASTTVFSPDIRNTAVAGGGGHSVINVAGGVSLNGALKPLFGAGVVPHLGDVWTLFDAAQVQGSFATSDATGTGAALPIVGQRYALTTAASTGTRVKGELTVENFLTAEVNRATGQVTIRNTTPSGTVGGGPGVVVTGYQIGSAGGALKAASFTSAFGGGAWQTAGVTANSISELNPTGNSVVGLGAANSVGNIYDPVSLETTFGMTPVADLTFSYSRSDGRTVTAPVSYINTGLANTLVLQVDPTDGKAKIVNDSVFNNIKLDGYQITSASSSVLTGWNSLQDQAVTGWEEASPTTASLAELNPTNSSTVNAGQSVATMTGLFKTTGVQDLAFTFRMPGSATQLNGVVRYAAFSAVLIGDYNNNGFVDAADYTIWRDKLGSPAGSLVNRDPGNSGAISMLDYNSWKNNFGSHSGAGAGALGSTQVPEPSTLVLALILSCGVLVVRGRHASMFNR
jgi:hypothetical protein